MLSLRIRNKDLSSHIGIYADTGGGKSLILKQYLREVERRGETAVVIDPDREFARTFRDVKRGDYILDPRVEESPYWALEDEVQDEAEATGLATCWFPDRPDVKDPYWNNAARGLCAYLMAYYHPNAATLGYWMAHDHLLDEKVEGSEFQRILTNTAPGLRSGVISHLNLAAQPLRMMPASPEGRRRFSVREWCKHRKGWLFLTSTPTDAVALRPLHTLWMASIIMRFIDMGKRKDLPITHLIFEEASSFVIQEFHMALVRLRKTRNPVVYAIQNYSDLEAAYGNKAKTIYSQPATKIFGRISDPDSAKRIEQTVGNKTVKRLKETYSFGRGGTQKSYVIQKEKEPLISQDDIQNLEDRCCVMLQPGVAIPFKIPILELPDRLPAIKERIIPPMEKRPDPELAPAPPAPVPSTEWLDTPSKRIARLVPKSNEAKPPSSLVLSVAKPAQDPCVLALAEHTKRIAEQDKQAGFKAEDFEGPPITRFICADKKHIVEFDGALEQPQGTCLQCGSEFYKIPGEGYVRNTVMKPNIKLK